MEQEIEIKEVQETGLSKSFSGWARACFWMCVVGSIVQLANLWETLRQVEEANSNGPTISIGRHGVGKGAFYEMIFDVIYGVAASIPEWVGNIIDTLGFIGLLIVLMKFLKVLGKPQTLVLSFMIFICGVSTICDIAGIESRTPGLLLWMDLVFDMILGITLIVSCRKFVRAMGIGITFIGLSQFFVGLLYLIIGWVSDDEWTMGYLKAINFCEYFLGIMYCYFISKCIVKTCHNETKWVGWTIWRAILIGFITFVSIALALFFRAIEDTYYWM